MPAIKPDRLLGDLTKLRTFGTYKTGVHRPTYSAEDVASRLLEHGLVISPGTFFGPSGEGYVRFALVPTEDECRRAAAILEEAL